jgi:hypothetical protein
MILHGCVVQQNRACVSDIKRNQCQTIKMLPEKPEPVLLAKILKQVAGLGRIHAAQPSFSFS